LGILPNVPGFLTTIKLIDKDACLAMARRALQLCLVRWIFCLGIVYLLLMKKFRKWETKKQLKAPSFNIQHSTFKIILMSLLIKNGRIITASEDQVADIFIEGEKIKTIGKDLQIEAADEVIDASGLLVFPGGIDPHVHLDMPFMGTSPATVMKPEQELLCLAAQPW
jgi:hypothetical protein